MWNTNSLWVEISIVTLIHGFVLPKKGINGWTGEPKGRYYDFRGWDKNIFREEENLNR